MRLALPPLPLSQLVNLSYSLMYNDPIIFQFRTNVTQYIDQAFKNENAVVFEDFNVKCWYTEGSLGRYLVCFLYSIIIIHVAV